MINTLREENNKILNTLLKDYNINPETILREVLENYLNSTTTFDFLQSYAEDMDIVDHFEQFRESEED